MKYRIKLQFEIHDCEKFEEGISCIGMEEVASTFIEEFKQDGDCKNVTCIVEEIESRAHER